MSLRYRLILTLVLVSSCVPGLRADVCKDDSAPYNGYIVQRVKIETTISFFAAATFDFDQLKARLPIQEKHKFTAENLSRGNKLIKDYLRLGADDADEKVKFIVVLGKPVDCDSTHRTVSVVYRVFTNVYRPYLSHTFEQRIAEVQRPSTTAAEGGTQGRFLIKPFVGYDHTVHGFGGLEASLRMPLGIVQSLELHSSSSTNSTIDDLDAAGSWDPHQQALEHTEWQMGFHYLDLPTGPAKLKEGKLAAQFVGSTKELTSRDVVLRFGGLVEGGHQQTGGVVPTSASPDSSFGSLKFYAGVTARASSQVFSTSYGVELGSTLRGSTLDFTKHVVDFGYGVRFICEPKGDTFTHIPTGVRKPLDIEFRASGGIIQNHGTVPFAERFYGGSRVQNFINGNTWVIPQGAMIRSIPENQLGGLVPGSLGSSGVVGGTRFYSGNLTVAKALWGRPLLPNELGQDKQFGNSLGGAMDTAQATLVDYYKSKDPHFEAVNADVDTLVHITDELTTQLDKLPADATGIPAIASGAKALRSAVGRISRTAGSIKKGQKTETTALVDLQLPHLETEVDNLAAHLTTAHKPEASSALDDVRQSIEKSRLRLIDDLKQVNEAVPKARAAADFAPARRVLKAFLYELNIYSVAPVAIFDVARVWPTSTSTRYAVGGGVRLSLAAVNFTLGYAANPKRNTGEGRGALFVSLDVTKLFH